MHEARCRGTQVNFIGNGGLGPYRSDQLIRPDKRSRALNTASIKVFRHCADDWDRRSQATTRTAGS